MVYALVKEGGPFIQVVHSVGKFSGDHFNPAEYQGRMICFVEGYVQGMELIPILIGDDAWSGQTARS